MGREVFFHTCRRRMNSLLTRASVLTGLSLNRPTYVCLKMTMKCNSRCVHCDIWKGAGVEADLPPALWISFLENLRKWLGKAHVVMTGGEALLAEGMLPVLRRACDLGLRVELLSNGLLLDGELAGDVIRSGVEQVTVSLDGALAATHDRFRGDNGFFDRTMSALGRLGDERDKAGAETVILLKTVVSSNNISELCGLAAIAEARRFLIRYQPIEQNYGEPEDRLWYRRSPWWVTDADHLAGEVEKLKKLRLEGFPIENTPAELDTMVEYFRNPEPLMAAVQEHDTRRVSRHCRYAMTNFVVSSNGDVRMCFKMEPIGNIAAETPQTIWKKRNRCWSSPCRYR